ncbi:MAG: tol-pal system-associated acyl-CoA thioesterase [Burkholderiales bacterium]
MRVYFQDTDAGGVVFHATYLNFLERARTEWLRSLGIALGALTDGEQILFIVRRLQADFRKPAKLDDLLQVSATLAKLGRAQITLAQQVVRNDELLLDAEVNLACVSREELRPVPLPEPIRTQLGLLQGRYKDKK